MEGFALMREISRMSTSRIVAVVISSCKQQLDKLLEREIFDTRNEANQALCDGCRSSSRARTTCGMPEPMAPGTKRRVHHSRATVSAGVHSRVR